MSSTFLKPQSESMPQKKLSTQMRAVYWVLQADSDLKQRIEPHINFETETIDWPSIFKISFGSGHRAAVGWIYSIWTDEPRPRANIFDGALSMSPNLQAAVLNALALRWGLGR